MTAVGIVDARVSAKEKGPLADGPRCKALGGDFAIAVYHNSGPMTVTFDANIVPKSLHLPLAKSRGSHYGCVTRN